MPQYPWESSYPPGVSWTPPLPLAPVEDFLAAAAATWPEKTAVDFYGRLLTYRELSSLAARAAKGLQALGVGPGVTVGLHLLNTPHHIICFFAVLMAGGRAANFNALAPARDLERQLADSESRVLVTLDHPMLNPVVALLESVDRLPTAVVVCSLEDFLPAQLAKTLASGGAKRQPGRESAVMFAELIGNDGAFRPHPHEPLHQDIAVLQYTGGTSGDQKAAMLTHANFSAVVGAIRHWTGDLMGHDAVILLVLPFFHIFGLAVLLLSVAAGSELVLHLTFDTQRSLADIQRKRATVYFGVPTTYAALVQHPAAKKFDLSSLRLCGSGGAPLPAEIFRRFKELTGLAVLEGYSLTETTNMGTWQPVGREPRPGSVGLPLPSTLLEIVDLETGMQVLPIGERGEVCFTGPQIMRGYWKNPEATAEALRGGRLHTGDIGFMDEHGYVTLVDRKKDMILCAGQNVFPRRLEKAICEHPTVAEAAVIGLPDPDLGQIAKAFVVLKTEHEPLTYGALRVFLKDKLAGYEIPTAMEIRQSLPKTAVGKLAKKNLVAEELAKQSLARAVADDGDAARQLHGNGGSPSLAEARGRQAGALQRESTD